MIRFFLARVLKWAMSINWATFLKVLPILAEAGRLFPRPDGATEELKSQINIRRAVYASTEISKLLPGAKGAGINFLREVGLLWLRAYPESLALPGAGDDSAV